MLTLETKLKIPFLWGKSVFKKSNWSQVNLIVGPNGSGKTLLAESLAKQFEQKGYKINFVKSERNNQNQQIFILKNNDEIRNRIENVLSNMFGKSIQFIEDIDGTLIPIVINKAWNVEYTLHDAECHGLKEIITLLINLYSNDNSCLFIDEPELHLHPQFQFFFMNEIRKEAQKNPSKIFFIITHSPFFIDLRSPEDLIGVIVCHINNVPTHIEKLDKEDYSLFKKFLPRFNTYHKQFFFSDNQIFVEGYTDQQMFTNLLPFAGNEYASAGTGIIDVGGKDELGVFCKVCSLLGTNGRIITDLDSLFSGKLRDVFCHDIRVNQWLEKQSEKQEVFFKTIFSSAELEQNISLDKLIFKLEHYLINIGKYIQNYKGTTPKKLRLFFSKLSSLQIKHGNADNVDTYKTVLLQGIVNQEKDLTKFLPPQLSKTLPIIKNLSSFIFAAAEAARVYILTKGCIEHYYTESVIQYMPVSSKDKLFRNELEGINLSDTKQIHQRYSELITLLEKACARN